MCNDINKLREELDNLLKKHGLGSEKILEISRELDTLIVKYYKKLQDD